MSKHKSLYIDTEALSTLALVQAGLISPVDKLMNQAEAQEVDKTKFYKEKYNNISIYRYKQYVPINPTFFKRIIHLTDFTLGSLINSFKIKNIKTNFMPIMSHSFLPTVIDKNPSL